jgi:chromate transporter
MDRATPLMNGASIRGHRKAMRAVGEAAETKTHPGSAVEVLLTFTRFGLTSFGGPVAHLGYFRAECVERRKWLDAILD